MKRLLLSLLSILFITANMAQDVMVIEKTDSTSIRINVDDIERAYFETSQEPQPQPEVTVTPCTETGESSSTGVSNLTSKSATISAKVTGLPDGIYTYIIYIGTIRTVSPSNYLHFIEATRNGSIISGNYIGLSGNTTYYYVIVITNTLTNNKYTSDVISFVTPSDPVPTPSFSIGTMNITNIEETTAQVNTKFTIKNATKKFRLGFFVSLKSTPTASNSTDYYEEYNKANYDGQLSKKVTGLKAETKYYLRPYILYDGKYEYGTITKFRTRALTSEEMMTTWLEYLCSKECAGRYVGTEGSRKAADYIVAQLSAMGYTPVIQKFEVAGVSLQNILVSIPGAKDSCIVIGAHYDGQFRSTNENHYPAANDNASGVVTLLKIAKDLSEHGNNSPYSIRLCFWDGEEDTLGSIFKGSDYYVKNSTDLAHIKYYQNIDSVGHDHNSSFRIYYYGDWFKEIVIPFIQSNYRLNYTEVAFKGKGVGSSDYVSFSKQGIPFINIFNDHSSGCGNIFHSVTDVPEVISIPLLCTMASIVENIMQL